MYQPLRLLILDTQCYYGGGETYKRDVIHILRSKGIECKVLLPKESEFRKILLGESIPVGVIKVKNRTDFLSMIRTALQFRNEKNLLVCTTDSITWYTGVFFRWFVDCRKLIAIVHITTAMGGKSSSQWKKNVIAFIDRLWTSKYDTIICSTEFHKAILVNEGVSAEKLKVVKNTIDLNVVEKTALKKSRTDICEQYSVFPDHLLVGMFGRFGSGKDYTTLVNAIPLIISEVPKTTFVLVGSGPQLPEIKSLVRKLNIENVVRFTGFVTDDYFPLMAAVDIVANISYIEGIPYVLLDAMALKKPIVATDVGGVHEVVHHNVNGILIPPGDLARSSGYAKKVAHELIQLLKDKEKRRVMGEKSRAIIKNEFSMERMSRSIQEIFLGETTQS